MAYAQYWVSTNQTHIPENIMGTYTLTATELNLEGLEIGLKKIANTTKALAPATKTALMLVAGPVLGLAFVIALPLVGLALVAYYAAKALATHRVEIARRVKNVALFLAAPVIGLAYMLAFPFVGIGTLVYIGVKAVRH